jgi:predicted TIM-barrel fold metal-dependent hydrolase
LGYRPVTGVYPSSEANRIGLDYRHEASRLPWPEPIIDGHIHISGLRATRTLMEVAKAYNIARFWSQTPLEEVDTLRAEFGDRFEFIAIPNYAARDRGEAFMTDWLDRLDRFRERGVRIAKFWAAPRGRDFHESIRLDHPTRRRAIRHAVGLGMMLMVHVADPDTWFATHYKDHRRYGTKASHYEPLRQLLLEYPHVPCLAAHLAGNPENIDHLQELLDRHPNLYMDISATKWMVRELSPRAARFAAFCRHNPGRVLWGTDNVVADANDDFDLYASRYWAMRTLMESDYKGPSPIVDPDLSLVDPKLPSTSTASMNGIGLDPATLYWLYHGAAGRLAQKARAVEGATFGQST